VIARQLSLLQVCATIDTNISRGIENILLKVSHLFFVIWRPKKEGPCALRREIDDAAIRNCPVAEEFFKERWARLDQGCREIGDHLFLGRAELIVLAELF
jgi:hypothetical protein